MADVTLVAKGYPEASGTKTLSGTTAQSVAVTNASGGQLLRDASGWSYNDVR